MADADPLPPGAISDRIRTMLVRSLLVPEASLDLDLLENGVIDSADFMELFLLLEAEFDIAIEAKDLVLDNFRTIELMAAFVRTKAKATP